MGPTRRRLIEASGTVFAVGLAGCLGGGDGGATTTAPDGTAPGTDAATTSDSGMDGGGAVEKTTTAGSTVTVQVREHEEYGAMLVDSEGMSLYMFDSDTQGTESSTCSGGCASVWPPLTVEGEPMAGEAVTADLETFERESGDTQVAANGWPLYYYASDDAPGDATGQGVTDAWWVLDPSGEPKRPATATPTPTSTPTDDGGDTTTDDGSDTTTDDGYY